MVCEDTINKEQLTMNKEKKYFSHNIIFHFSLFPVLCSLLLLSCQTLPRMPEAYFSEGILPLDSGAAVYLFADAKEAKFIINNLPIKELKNDQVRQMINRTDFIAVALFSIVSGRRFQIAAWGNYPKSGAEMVLGANKNWNKRNAADGSVYWYSDADKLSMAVNSKQIFASVWLKDSNVIPYNAAQSVNIPEGFNDFRKAAVFSCWLENSNRIIQQMLNKTGLPVRMPVQQLFLSVNKVQSQKDYYEAAIRLQFENASQARGAAAILNLAGAFTSSDPELKLIMLFLANPPVQKDRSLEIKTNPLSEDEIINIIQIFSF